MAANVGLRFALTIAGVVELVIPHLFSQRLKAPISVLNIYLNTVRLKLDFTRRKSRFILRRAKHGIINRVSPPRSRFLDLPFEVRTVIWRWVCAQEPYGSVPGVLHVLLINKQIWHEAQPFFDTIEHRIQIGDITRHQSDSIMYMGLPQIITINDTLDWHMASLKHLVLDLKVFSIGIMTPDCFDVNIAHNGKEQWRNLKRLIGVWPELREVPLETIRLVLSESVHKLSRTKTYRADLIRVIRNFKRTKVWAETRYGDCSQRRGNQSMLLPLVRAFNQGRRNWVVESTEENNLIVRYGSQALNAKSIDITGFDEKEEEAAEAWAEAQTEKWSVVPTDDTSRSESSSWPQWSGKEEQYIYEKMVKRVRENGDDREFECRECLAVFDKPKELKEHLGRGRSRTLC